MRAVDLAEMLREVIDKCKREIRLECTMTVEKDRLQALMAYQWVNGRIQDSVIENEETNVKIQL
jgi:hypothetical protein